MVAEYSTTQGIRKWQTSSTSEMYVPPSGPPMVSRNLETQTYSSGSMGVSPGQHPFRGPGDLGVYGEPHYANSEIMAWDTLSFSPVM